MPDTWVNIYLWIIIGWSLFDLFLHILRPLSRIFGKSKTGSEHMKTVRRRFLTIEASQLMTGVIGLVLFRRGILGGWAVFVFCGVLLAGGFVWFLLTSPHRIEHKH